MDTTAQVQMTSGSASGWSVWQDPSTKRWLWSAYCGGESLGGSADNDRVAQALAMQHFTDLQARQRRRTLRSV
jgi:hypothetical protein